MIAADCVNEHLRQKSDLNIVMVCIGGLSMEFERALSGKTVPEYLDLVCRGFEVWYPMEEQDATKARDYIEAEESVFSKIRESLWKYKAMVLNIAGVRAELGEVQSVISQVSDVIRWLDDLLCEAIVDPDNLCLQFHAKKLGFQQL
jgi:hypothetical protein